MATWALTFAEADEWRDRFAAVPAAVQPFVDRGEIAQRNLARHAGLDLFNTKQIWIQRLSAAMNFDRNVWPIL